MLLIKRELDFMLDICIGIEKSLCIDLPLLKGLEYKPRCRRFCSSILLVRFTLPLNFTKCLCNHTMPR